jgi:protein phosphatase
LFVVADGMGGQNAGNVASCMTVDAIASYIGRAHGTDEISWPFGVDADLGLASNRLLTAVRVANRRVWKESDETVEYLGMGSTVVALYVLADDASLCSAGDSRAYALSDGHLHQLSQDDSWIRMALEQGLIEEGDAEKHPLRNVITSAIGAEQKINPQVVEVTLEVGTTLLLCSDGLYKYVEDETILETAAGCAEDLQRAAQALVDVALQNNANDDVTVVLVRRT